MQAMTDQEIFDHVARHLFTQGQQAWSSHDEPTCAYRSREGLSCAVGCLIPDADYNPRMEGYPVSMLIEEPPDQSIDISPELLSFLRDHVDFLSALQDAHDQDKNWRSTRTMRDVLEEIAKSQGVSHSILDTLSFADR